MSISQDGAKSVLAELERRLKEGRLVDEEDEVVKEMPKLIPPAEKPRLPHADD